MTPPEARDPSLGVGDFALVWSGGSADLAKDGDDLAEDRGLDTSILLSLFTDRRALDSDILPTNDNNRRGWWGDEFAEVEGDRMGNRLWLLDRAKKTSDVLRQAEDFDREALQWLLDDLVTDRIDVEVTAEPLEGSADAMVHAIDVHKPDGSVVSYRFAHVWDDAGAPGVIADPAVAALKYTVAGLHVDASDLSLPPSDGYIVAWEVSWGDGSPVSTGPGPWAHDYADDSGTPYTVTLTITTSAGVQVSVSYGVYVSTGWQGSAFQEDAF